MMKTDCTGNTIFDFIFNTAFQQWVRLNLPLDEFCLDSKLEILEEAATAIRLLDNQKITVSEQVIKRNYNNVLNKIWFFD